MHYDVFNGDADGICSLIQLRLHKPQDSVLVTGVKRDIKLLSQVEAADDVDSVTVLDISMEKNSEPLAAILAREVPVFYSDHHRHGEIPQSNLLETVIDLDAETCTSLLINQHLGDAHAKWAVAGAFGDNLFASAQKLAERIGLSQDDVDFLKELGTLINYNGYGATLSDLHVAPAELYKLLIEYPCPLMLKDDLNSPYFLLKKGFEADSSHVESLEPVSSNSVATVYELPCEAWARRISGVFGNDLANRAPDTAHAVLTMNASGQDYTVSVRAPLNNRVGADEICSSFPTGGGRRAAAGINALPLDAKADFISALNNYYE